MARQSESSRSTKTMVVHSARTTPPKKAGVKRSRSGSLSAGAPRKATRTSTPTVQLPDSQHSARERLCNAKESTSLRSQVDVQAILGRLQAVIVNLDRRPDRLSDCAWKLKANCPWLPWTRFNASDGRRDEIALTDVGNSWNTARNVVYQKLRSQRKNWDDLHTYQEKDLVLSPGERGCALSHIRAWKHCLDVCSDDDTPLLVLEDDADPTAEFTSNLKNALVALPKDPHVLYLGYSQASEWRSEISPNLAESDYVWTTVGYLVWPAGARLMLSQLPVDQPVDNFMADLCARGQMRSYCVRPKVVLQAEAWNVNSDVGHSDEVTPSDIRHSDSFYWGLDPRSALDKTDGENGTLFWDMGSSDSEEE